ncbi:hypothetical protein BCT84_02335 [Vibrio breoganii]|nr:hypothetical protein BCT84_02335 [Vibrio breoganii]
MLTLSAEPMYVLPCHASFLALTTSYSYPLLKTNYSRAHHLFLYNDHSHFQLGPKTMRLYITEKKEVATALASALGNQATAKNGYLEAENYRITWCSGHLFALQDPEDHNPAYKRWSLDDLPMTWPVKLKPIPRTSKQLKVVQQLISEASEIVHAGDPDAAGQAIVDNVINSCSRKPPVILRALINDNNPGAIRAAINNLRPNEEFIGLYLDETARSVADQRLGYQLTRLLTTQAQKQNAETSLKLNVGRVQSAILGLCVRRMQTRESHKIEYYYTLKIATDTPAGPLFAKLNPTEELGLELDHEGRFFNKEEIERLAESLEGATVSIESIERKRAKDSPTLPFDLLSLQIEASRLYGLSPDETLAITQTLREKLAISYNRCDTRYLTDEKHAEAPQVIANLATIPAYTSVANMVNPSIKSRAFNTAKTTAHHALAPTGNVSQYEKFSRNEKVIYALICRNYLIQFMSKREREITTYSILVQTEAQQFYTFEGKCSRVIELGWEVLFSRDQDSDEIKESQEEDNSDIDTNSLYAGQAIAIDDINVGAQQTKALPVYTIETLLKDLQHTSKYVTDPKIKQYLLDKDSNTTETGGIGTPATRSDILKKLFDNGILLAEGNKTKKITPTENGYLLYDMLPTSITSPNTTAIWAHQQKLISELKLECEDFWTELDEFIRNETMRIKEHGLNIPKKYLKAPRPQSQCPLCSAQIPLLKGKFGNFFKCGDCNKTFPELNKKPFHKACPECSQDLRIIKPKKGKSFIGCTGFPECKHTE